MYATSIDSLLTSQPAARLGGEYGYRMEGDSASLNAALSVLDGQQLAAADWALQLWACDPDTNGRLQGIKVAEVALGALHAYVSGNSTVAGETIALPPAGNGVHTMVLALASGCNGQYGQIHDFAVFDRPQNFSQPRLDGVVGYEFGDHSVRLSVERIDNPREAGSLSGTLALELWALDVPYAGGAFAGSLVGGVQLGSLGGQSDWREVSANADAAALAAGTWNLVLMLREWTPAGFVTRDYSNFAAPHVVAPLEAAPLQAVVEAPAVAAAATEAKAAVAASATEVKAGVEAKATKTVAATAKADTLLTKPVATVARAAATESKAAAAPAAEAKATTVPAATPAKVEVAAAKPAATAALQAATPIAAKVKAVADTKASANEATRKPAASSAIVKTAKALPSINTASADELAAIKGLSKTVAKAIVAARPYKSLDELTRAKGVGEKLLAKLRQQISL